MSLRHRQVFGPELLGHLLWHWQTVKLELQRYFIMSETESKLPVWVDLLAACQGTAHSGPQWAHECDDLDMTLLSWREGRHIEAHINREVDVILVGIEGVGVVTVDGEAHNIHPGVGLLIPKGGERAIKGTSERFSYLSIHRRRHGLQLTKGRSGNTVRRDTPPREGSL